MHQRRRAQQSDLHVGRVYKLQHAALSAAKPGLGQAIQGKNLCRSDRPAWGAGQAVQGDASRGVPAGKTQSSLQVGACELCCQASVVKPDVCAKARPSMRWGGGRQHPTRYPTTYQPLRITTRHQKPAIFTSTIHSLPVLTIFTIPRLARQYQHYVLAISAIPTLPPLPATTSHSAIPHQLPLPVFPS